MPISAVGRTTIHRIGGFGGFLRFVGRTLLDVLTAPHRWGRRSVFVPLLYFIGTTSIPVVALTGAFIGAILAVEGYDTFAAFGIENRLGAAVNISLVKQIGPVLAAVMLAGRVGCALAAEIGSMKVTDQLDAIRVLGASPIRVLVSPRVVACVVMIPILTVVSNLLGVAGAWLSLVPIADVDNDAYWLFSEASINWWDIANGLIKSVFFGLAIGIIACYKGFHCKPGAVGVGKATTDAFVTSFVAIVIINFLLAKFLNDLGTAYFNQSAGAIL